jgi:outer membrane protein TolC
MKSISAVIVLLAIVLVRVAGAQNTESQVQAQVSEVPSSSPLTLDQLIAWAMQSNPAIQSAQRRVNGLRHVVPQAKALPEPTVTVGWNGNPTPFSVQQGDPSSSRMITAAQVLPFPGKLKLKGEIAEKEADSAQWQYEAVRRKVIADIKAAYFEYFFYDRALQTTQRNHDLLKQLSQIAEARYRVGKAQQQDVLKSQVELSTLLQRLTVLEQQRDTTQARLNTLLARAPETPLPPAADLPLVVVRYTLDEVYALAKQNDPALQEEQQMVERNQLAVNLAERQYYPDFSFSYTYQQRPGLPDMYGAAVSVNIPIFYKSRQREGVAQATEDLIGSQKSRQSREYELYFEIKQQYLAAKASQQLLDLYSKGVVPQSSLALESSMAAYQVGNVDFLTIISNFTTALNYEIDYYRELANFRSSIAQIEALVGVDVSAPQTLDVAPVPKEEK